MERLLGQQGEEVVTDTKHGDIDQSRLVCIYPTAMRIENVQLDYIAEHTPSWLTLEML